MNSPARTSTFNPRLALVAAAVCALGLFSSHDASAALPAATRMLGGYHDGTTWVIVGTGGALWTSTDGVNFTGNANGTVDGTVIGLANLPMTMSGNGTVTIASVPARGAGREASRTVIMCRRAISAISCTGDWIPNGT